MHDNRSTTAENLARSSDIIYNKQGTSSCLPVCKNETVNGRSTTPLGPAVNGQDPLRGYANRDQLRLVPCRSGLEVGLGNNGVDAGVALLKTLHPVAISDAGIVNHADVPCKDLQSPSIHSPDIIPRCSQPTFSTCLRRIPPTSLMSQEVTKHDAAATRSHVDESPAGYPVRTIRWKLPTESVGLTTHSTEQPVEGSSITTASSAIGSSGQGFKAWIRHDDDHDNNDCDIDDDIVLEADGSISPDFVPREDEQVAET